MCPGNRCYAEKWYQSRMGDVWQQPFAEERAEYTNVSVATKRSASRQNCHVSERIVSAAEQLYMLASAQTTSFSEQNGFIHCRSSSRDSGLGKDSDSGSSSSGIQVPGPVTQTFAQSYPYIEDPESPRHHSKQSSSQPPNQPVCAVLPMRNSGRNTSCSTAGMCDIPRYSASESEQQEVFQHLNRCEVFSGRSPQLAQQHRFQPEFSDCSCRNGNQHWGQRFPIAENVAYCGNTVNPLHYSGSHMPSAYQQSRYRGYMSGQATRYTTGSMYGFSRGRGMEYSPPAGDITDSVALVPDHHLTGTSARVSTFDYVSRQDTYDRLAPAERLDKLLYRKHHNVNTSCRPAVDLHRHNADVTRCRVVQQRYQPYAVSADICHGNGTMPRGGNRNLFTR